MWQPHSGESQIAVVPVTLRDSVLVAGVSMRSKNRSLVYRISGLVAEYIVAIDVARVRFPADASRGGRARPSASVEVYQACRIPMSRASIRSQSVSEAHL